MVIRNLMKDKSLEETRSFENESYETLMSILDYYSENESGLYDEVDFIEECVAQDAEESISNAEGRGDSYSSSKSMYLEEKPPDSNVQSLMEPESDTAISAARGGYCEHSSKQEMEVSSKSQFVNMENRKSPEESSSFESGKEKDALNNDLASEQGYASSPIDEGRTVSLALINAREDENQSYHATFGGPRIQKNSSMPGDEGALDSSKQSPSDIKSVYGTERVGTSPTYSGDTGKHETSSYGIANIPHPAEGISSDGDLFSKIKINRIYVDSDIIVSKPRNTRFKKQKRLINAAEEKDSKAVNVVLFDSQNSLQESLSGSSLDTITKDEAFQIFREAERRTLEKDLLSGYDRRSRRFVIDKESQYLKIESVIKLNELKTRNLIGKIYKKGKNGRYQHNWFTLRENFFTCYNGRKHEIFGQNIPSERDGDLKDPTNTSFFFKKKYTLDLLNTKIYLVKERSCFGCVGWTSGFDIDNNLIDITDEMKIIRVEPVKNHFVIYLKKNLVRTEIKMNSLDFALRNNDGIYFYRSQDIDSFLGWIVAFAFRQGRITCDIG